MSALFLALISIIGFLLAYFLYARFLQEKIFSLRPEEKLPSREREDGIDFVPTRRSILFSHHFVSIAGLGPIMGPAIGVIWGWLPAFLWVFFGTIFLGAAHDFGSLIISLRNEGRPIGEVVRDLIGLRAGTLFMLVIFFLLSLAMGVFALIIAVLFTDFHPIAVIPVFALIPIAMLVGYMMYRRNVAPVIATSIGVILMFGMIEVGLYHPVPIYQRFLPRDIQNRIVEVNKTGIIPDITHPVSVAEYFQEEGEEETALLVKKARINSIDLWIYILLIYAFFASVLPVWFLLQPRDYLNSFELYIGVILIYLGIFLSRPEVTAPVLHLTARGMPPLFPFLFIIIACGAISGFHNLVSSGTTVRQLGRIRDARVIGYGGMLAEGLLAVVVIITCTATIGSRAAWLSQYGDFSMMNKLGPKLNVFIEGSGIFISQLGIPKDFAIGLISVVVVSFAMTTLDSGTRLMRYNIEALGTTFKIKPLKNRYLSSLIGICAIGYFALMKIGGHPAGLTLWELFGTTNQLLAALGLLAISVYLFEIRRRTIYFTIPMGFMLVVTLTAMVLKLLDFWEKGSIPLMITGVAILILTIWLLIEAFIIFRRFRSARKEAAGKSI
ncbi:MAG: carbon starvation protein A [Candidatus Auribacterota bacterium]|nr:carbon starvation protein A [Candidatus Auribacterota bacterium]